MDDMWMPTYDEVNMVMSDFGYYLNDMVFDILSNFEDPNDLSEEDWNNLYQSLNVQDQDSAMEAIWMIIDEV